MLLVLTKGKKKGFKEQKEGFPSKNLGR